MPTVAHRLNRFGRWFNRVEDPAMGAGEVMLMADDAYRSHQVPGRLFLTNRRLVFLPELPRFLLFPALWISNKPVYLPLDSVDSATFRQGQDRFSWMAKTPNMRVALTTRGEELFAVVNPWLWIDTINAQLAKGATAETTEDA